MSDSKLNESFLFNIEYRMSLLDQLSSLCLKSGGFQHKLYSLADSVSTITTQTATLKPNQAVYRDSNINGENNNHHSLTKYDNAQNNNHSQYNQHYQQQQVKNSAQKKMIKLFDDQQLYSTNTKPKWKFIHSSNNNKTQTKPYAQSLTKQNCKEDMIENNNCTQFKQQQPNVTMKPLLLFRQESFQRQKHIYPQEFNIVALSNTISDNNFNDNDNNITNSITYNNYDKNKVNIIDSNDLLVVLTKLSYKFKNKFRKINYDFFVRLETYCKAKIKQQQQLIQQKQTIIKQKLQLFINKLTDSMRVLNLKYYNNSTDGGDISSQAIHRYQDVKHEIEPGHRIKSLQQAFQKIRSQSIICEKLHVIIRHTQKVLYRKFIQCLQKYNKQLIKIDLFEQIVLSTMKKRTYDALSEGWKQIKSRAKMMLIDTIDTGRQLNINIETSFPTIPILQQRKESYQPFRDIIIVPQPQRSPLTTINIKQSQPLILINPHNIISTTTSSQHNKSNPIKFQFQQHYQFHKQVFQNIPLKLHNLKTHDQQTNIPDCIDNGHLLMTQIKTNSKLKQQLQNLTISNINSKTPNSSMNSSCFMSQNFILPQFNHNNNNTNNSNNINNNNETTDRTMISQSANTMRKSTDEKRQKVKTATLIPQSANKSSSNPAKQPRKSLVITKRKQSMNEFNSYGKQLYNTDRQKVDSLNLNKKPKSTTNSHNKINQKQSAVNDKEIIKRMLQELNEKFSCHDKIIKITLENKNPTSGQKKQQQLMNSSGKKTDKKKAHSQLAPNDFILFNNNKAQKSEKNSRQASVKNQKLTLKNSSNKKSSNKKQIKQKHSNHEQQHDVSICFMPIEQHQSNLAIKNERNNPTGTIMKQPSKSIDNEHRMKQSKSELTKKNSTQMSQNSQDSEICKILSKYRPKKALFPESNLKIDLVLNQKNYDTIETQKQNNYYLGLTKPVSIKQQQYRYNESSFGEDNKFKNSIFFREMPGMNLMNTSQNNISLNTSQLSLITPKQSIRESFFSKKLSNAQLSSDRDSALAQYISYLPEEKYFQQNEEENHYNSLKPQGKKDNDTVQTKYYFETVSKKQLFNKPNSINSSMERKRTSFDKNKNDWDLMFEKQKKRFFKNEQVPKMTKKKSLLNEDVITQIKNKIQKCFILSQKDQNLIKTDLEQKKPLNQQKFNEQKNNQTTKSYSQNNSKRNSLSKLYTTLNKLKRPEPL